MNETNFKNLGRNPVQYITIRWSTVQFLKSRVWCLYYCKSTQYFISNETHLKNNVASAWGNAIKGISMAAGQPSISQSISPVLFWRNEPFSQAGLAFFFFKCCSRPKLFHHPMMVFVFGIIWQFHILLPLDFFTSSCSLNLQFFLNQLSLFSSISSGP